MKLAIQEALCNRFKLSIAEVEELGFRGWEAEVTEVRPEPTQGFPPAILQTPVLLGAEGDRLGDQVWRAWFTAARSAGAQGVAVAVQQENESDPTLGARIGTLAALASSLGSRLLLAVQSGKGTEATSHAALLAHCRRLDGDGVGLILDVEVASAAGESPVKLLRAGEGYVQHVRIPDPRRERVAQSEVIGVLRELQRISYIDYVTLLIPDASKDELAAAVKALRQAVVAAWTQ